MVSRDKVNSESKLRRRRIFSTQRKNSSRHLSAEKFAVSHFPLFIISLWMLNLLLSVQGRMSTVYGQLNRL